MWLATTLLSVSLTPGETVPVRVDPRVELLTIVWRLIEADEFNQPSSRSPYAREVEEWFGVARDHEVFEHARSLRRLRGISFNAVPDLAVHLTPLPELALRVPLDPLPERMDPRWRGANLVDFLARLRSFAEETDFQGFVAEHAELYRAAEASLAKQVEDSRVVEWMKGFFGVEQGTSYTAVAGLLCGSGNYGASVRLPDGTLELWPVLGADSWNAQGHPEFGAGVIPTVVHEFTHAFANPIVDAHWSLFEPSMGRLFEPVAEVMARQAYSTPRIYAYESLVRACVVRHTARYEGDEGARRQIEYESGRGFTHTAALAACLAGYEAKRDEYATLSAFGPELARLFARESEALAAPAEAASKAQQRPANEPR
jgi:hypothetical protein